MKIVITGARGMLGCDLVAAAGTAGHDVTGWDLPELDITGDLSPLDRVAGAEVLVNCAAYTDVDGAESHEAAAMAVNRDGAERVARWCAGGGVRLVHISTDYVFDGCSGTPYAETAEPKPLGAYGRTKLAGEKAVRACCPAALVVRTQSLFGRHGRNFVAAILAQLEQGTEPLRVVADQVSSPTYTRHLAAAILHLLAGQDEGIMHVSASGQCSWHEFAVEIAAQTGSDREIEAVGSDGFLRPAPRPAFSVLDCSGYEAATGQMMPEWKEGLKKYLEEIGAQP